MKINNSDLVQILSAAIQAPSGHNTQPWFFEVNNSSVKILPNKKMSLPVVDPLNRELFISLGAAVENLCIEAFSLGYFPEVILNPKNESISVDLVIKEGISLIDLGLEKYIHTRQTNRSTYKGSISKEKLGILEEFLVDKGLSKYVILKDNPLFSILKGYVKEGNEIQMGDKYFKRELINHIRFNRYEVKKYQSGLSYKVMGAPELPRFISKMIMKGFLNGKMQNKTDIPKIDSSSALVLFTTQTNSFEAWIDAGRNLERFLLKLTQLGISYSFMNQPIEVNLLSERMRNEVKLIEGQYPTLLLRLGYADAVAYSPRRDVEDVIVNGR